MIKNINLALKNRINGPAAALLKEDIRRIRKQDYAGWGISWTFGGSNGFYSKLKQHYLDQKSGNLNFEGIVLPEFKTKIEIQSFITEFFDVIAPYIKTPYPIKTIQSLYNDGLYENENIKVAPYDIVIDAGANIGMFSAFAASRGKDVKVYAFEPIPNVIHSLNKVADVNKNIQVVPLALSNITGEMEIFMNGFMTSSLIRNGNRGSKITAKVETITLDSYINKSNIKKVDFIKADIEGAERFLLQGAVNILKDFSPKLSICKYHLPDDPMILKQLILDANPKYNIEEQEEKIFAYVPNSMV